MDCAVLPLGAAAPYRYVVVLSRFQGRLLLSRHKARRTWETQGGHIEQGETPLAAAKRELWEESGAQDYTLTPLCDYRAGDEAGCAAGQVFFAQIHVLGPLPDSEMAQVAGFDALPDNLTYPAITPKLYGAARAAGLL